MCRYCGYINLSSEESEEGQGGDRQKTLRLANIRVSYIVKSKLRCRLRDEELQKRTLLWDSRGGKR
jgi:hypothetical protein